MNKLFGFKQWVTIPEAAQWLSVILEGPVTEADVMQLALEGHLPISVDLVNGAFANICKIVPLEDAETKEIPGLDGVPLRVVDGIRLGERLVIQCTDEVGYIRGFWNLPMYGGDRFYIKNKYLELTHGPKDTSIYIDGTFLRGKDGCIFRLVEEYEAKSARVRAGNLVSNPQDFFPSASLPDDCALYVLTESITEFIEKIPNVKASTESPCQRQERIIGFVNGEKSRGKAKTDSFKLLAESEGCGVENIKRIYYKKDSAR